MNDQHPRQGNGGAGHEPAGWGQQASGPDGGEIAAGRPPPERLAYSVAEVALITGLSRDLLYDQMRAGRLAYVKVGRRRIISRQHLEAFLAQGAA